MRIFIGADIRQDGSIISKEAVGIQQKISIL
jgi:hypothetical protein